MHEIGLGRVFSYLCGWIDRMWRRWSAHASKNGRREINAANLLDVFGLGVGFNRCRHRFGRLDRV